MRSLGKQFLSIPLNRGMDQSADELLVDVGNLYNVENLRLRGDGLLQKRYGSSGIVATSVNQGIPLISTAGATMYKPLFLSKVQDSGIVGNSAGSVFAIDKDSGYSYPIGRFPRARPVRKRTATIPSPTSELNRTMPSVAVSADGQILVAYAVNGELIAYTENPAGVRTSLFFEENQTVRKAVVLYHAAADHFFLLYEVDEAGTYKIYYITVSVTKDGVTKSAATDTTLTVHGVSTNPGVFTSWDAHTNPNDTQGAGSEFKGLVYIVLQDSSSTVVLASFRVLNTPFRLDDLTLDKDVSPSSFSNHARCTVYVDNAENIWITTAAPTQTPEFRVLTTDDGFTYTTVLGATALDGPNNVATNNLVNVGPFLLGEMPGFTSGRVFCVYRVFQQAPPSSNRAPIFGTVFRTLDTSGAIGTRRIAWNVVPLSKPDHKMRVWSHIIQRHGGLNVSRQGVETTLSRVALINYENADQGQTSITDSPTVELALPRTTIISEGMLPSNPHDLSYQYLQLFNTPVWNKDRYYFAFPFILSNLEKSKLVRIEVLEYEDETAEDRDVSETGQSSIISGGIPTEVFGFTQPVRFQPTGTDGAYSDNAGASEVGFLHPPAVQTLTLSSGTALISTGSSQLSYKAVYEWSDVYGRRHRSQPSEAVPTLITPTGANGEVSFRVLTQSVSQKNSGSTAINPVKIRIYRTLGGGVAHHSLPTLWDAYSPSGYVDIVDNAPDDVIADEEILYTDGGGRSNDLAPSCRFSTVSETRVWWGGGWVKNQIYASKFFLPDQAVEFTDHPSHTVVLPFDCTALSHMDGQVIAFGQDSIALIPSAGGPNNQGIGAFPEPRIHSTGIGAVDHRGIVETKLGVFFENKKGIYLLPRGFGEVIFIGKLVRNIQESYPKVLAGAAYTGNGDELVRFLVGASGAKMGNRVLSFDLERKQWFTDIYAGATLAAMGAFPGGFALARADFVGTGIGGISGLNQNQVLLLEHSDAHAEASWRDSSTNITPKIKTSRIKPFGPGGWGHVKRVVLSFVAQSDTVIHCDVQTDYNTTQESQRTVVQSTQEQWWDIPLNNQQCNSVQLTIYDATANKGIKYVQVTLEVKDSGGVRLMDISDRTLDGDKAYG